MEVINVEGYKVELERKGDFINARIPDIPGLGMTFDKNVREKIPEIMREMIVARTKEDLMIKPKRNDLQEIKEPKKKQKRSK
jgi:hypothetical protein